MIIRYNEALFYSWKDMKKNPGRYEAITETGKGIGLFISHEDLIYWKYIGGATLANNSDSWLYSIWMNYKFRRLRSSNG